MDSQLDDDIYTNDVQYFFSLHGPRFEYMNEVMAASLSKRFGKEFRPIRILNAWPGKKYAQANYIVLNKKGYKLAGELGKPVIMLIDYEDVNVEFAQNSTISKIAKNLLRKQSTIFVYPFTTAFLELPESTFTVIGPNSELARRFDSKINQAVLFEELGLPHNNAQIFESADALREHLPQLGPCYVSAAYTSGGFESGLIYSPEMLEEFLARLRPINKRSSFTAAQIFENITLAPNTNAIVSSDGKVSVLVLSDQILQGNRYLGNIYPSEASKKQQQEIIRITTVIGEYLASQGYKGLFGCDFLINQAGDLVVIDLNPRHQGGYTCNGLMLASMGISLTDLELSTFYDEPLRLTAAQLQKPLGFSWAHSKVFPYEKGQTIHNELALGSIEETFKTIGSSFVAEFYKSGSVFIAGYTGYQVHTSHNRDDLAAKLLETKKHFEAEVLDL